MLAFASDDGIHLLEFVERKNLNAEIERLQKKWRCEITPSKHHWLESLTIDLIEYFNGSSLAFRTPFVLTGTEFQCSVWSELQKIPVGTTRTYSQLATRIHKPNAVRAVGKANGDNCLALIVPCHRVIGADGSLTGYAAGIARKQWLLEHEMKFAK